MVFVKGLSNECRTMLMILVNEYQRCMNRDKQMSMIPNDFRCYSYLNVGTCELLQDRFAGDMLSQEMGNSSHAAKKQGPRNSSWRRERVHVMVPNSGPTLVNAFCYGLTYKYHLIFQNCTLQGCLASRSCGERLEWRIRLSGSPLFSGLAMGCIEG